MVSQLIANYAIQQPNLQAPNLEFLASRPFDSQAWFPDYGASHHITSDAQNLSQRAPYTGIEQVMLGNGQGLAIQSIGSSKLVSNSNPSFPLALNNLLHVPHITKNLLSISQFAKDNNVYFEFHPSSCFVKSQVTNQVVLEGLLGADELYRFQHCHIVKESPCQSSALPSSPSCNSITSSSFMTWHARLGHAHSSAIKTVLHLCNIPFSNKIISDFCNACCLGKAHRLQSPASTSIYSSHFELIYTNLWGPVPLMSSCGYSYYMTFVDAHSKFTWLYFLKQKSKALTAFKQFSQLIKTQFNAIIKSVQSNCGEGRISTLY